MRCRRVDVDVEVWSSGALEVRCSRRDIEVWRSGALEMRRRRVDVWTCGRGGGGIEVRSSGDALQPLKN